jgi:hypothetical protein
MASAPMSPAAGSEVVAPAETTPGISASFGSNSWKKRAAICLSGYCDGGKPTRKVSVFFGSIPMS